MSKYIGQIQGAYSTGYDLINAIMSNAGNHVERVTKVGIQLEYGREIMINREIKVEMGKSGQIEFEDVDIQHLQILKRAEESPTDYISVPIIVDYVYEDE